MKNPHRGTSYFDKLKEDLKSQGFKREYEKSMTELRLGQMVRRIIKQRKISMRDLAKRMGTSTSQVIRLMNDKNVSIEALIRFADATGKKLLIDLKDQSRAKK